MDIRLDSFDTDPSESDLGSVVTTVTTDPGSFVTTYPKPTHFKEMTLQSKTMQLYEFQCLMLYLLSLSLPQAKNHE